MQLAFFPFRKPLLERLGADFFKGIPRGPGVYTFLSEHGKVLYVGQSKDLRTRLGYYKNARPDREPRRILRMIGRARAITFQLCGCAEEALARELMLIQEHRPTYNRALNGNPRHPFVALKLEHATAEARLVESPEKAAGELFGAFRGAGRCRRLLHALGRLCWCAEHPKASVYDIPLRLSEDSRAREVELGCAHAPAAWWREYFSGESDSLSELFLPMVEAVADVHLKVILENDLLLLGEFFKAGPEMNRRIAELHHLKLPIAAGELDGLRLRSRRRAKVALGEWPEESERSRL